MNQLVIAIDCDDVLIDLGEPLVEWYNQTYKTSLSLADWYGDDLQAYGVNSMDDAIERVYTYLKSDNHAQLKPNPVAIDAVSRLCKQHELHLVTGRPKFLEPITKAMLTTYFPGMFQTVEHTSYYGPGTDDVGKSRSKGEVCGQIRADILIDDHVAHGKDVLNHGVKEVLLFGDYPWNQTDDDIPGVTRCPDWQSVLKHVGAVSDEA